MLASASVEKGQQIAKQCTACHTFEKGGPNRIGPNLWGIVGDERGKDRGGFNFSAAMKAKGGTWTFDELYDFLANPRDYIPGTAMTFAGISREPATRRRDRFPPHLVGQAAAAAESGGGCPGSRGRGAGWIRACRQAGGTGRGAEKIARSGQCADLRPGYPRPFSFEWRRAAGGGPENRHNRRRGACGMKLSRRSLLRSAAATFALPAFGTFAARRRRARKAMEARAVAVRRAALSRRLQTFRLRQSGRRRRAAWCARLPSARSTISIRWLPA